LLLHRATERDVTVLDAERCVRLATLGGAEALGLGDAVGSLEPGKFADFIAVDVSRSHFEPIANPCSALVYGANQDDVFLTVVGGRVLYRDRVFTTVEDAAFRRAAHVVRQRLQERVKEGVQVGSAESGWWRPAPAGSGAER
jgi:5-methylthioadenosine/S-adenosylhomocysteine deaminase